MLKFSENVKIIWKQILSLAATWAAAVAGVGFNLATHYRHRRHQQQQRAWEFKMLFNINNKIKIFVIIWIYTKMIIKTAEKGDYKLCEWGVGQQNFFGSLTQRKLQQTFDY